MPLPDQCQLRQRHLVFSELATETQLDDTDALYAHCCFVACTNGLRPAGPLEVVHAPIPQLDDGTSVMWGNRLLSAEAAVQYVQHGYRLCELRLPVVPMGPQ